MHEKNFAFQKDKDRLKVFLVLGFFLVSGIWYSHGVKGDTFVMGQETPVEQLAAAEERVLSAESLLGKVDLNRADAAELMRLSGIGEKLAAEIISYREEHGGFQAIEDIMQVSGIGEKTFAEIKEEITVGE